MGLESSMLKNNFLKTIKKYQNTNIRHWRLIHMKTVYEYVIFKLLIKCLSFS